VLNVSASSGTMNVLAYDPDEATEVLSLSVCDLYSLNVSVSYDTSLSGGMYGMTVIDWTDDPRCSLLVDHTLIVFKPQGQLFVPYAINQGITQGYGLYVSAVNGIMHQLYITLQSDLTPTVTSSDNILYKYADDTTKLVPEHIHCGYWYNILIISTHGQ